MKYFCLFIFLLGLLPTNAALAQEDELLPPEQAFALSARLSGEQLQLDYQIAPGYYLYRKRFEFEIEDASNEFGEPLFPAGSIVEDEFFGKSEIYRDSLRILLPLKSQLPTAGTLQVKVTSQGCADIGVCYPPQKQVLRLQTASSDRVMPQPWVAAQNDDDNVANLQQLLMQANRDMQSSSELDLGGSEETGQASAIDILQALGEDSGLDNDDEILHPDQAFMLSAKLQGDQIRSSIVLADNIYIYRDKIKITMLQGNGHATGKINLPRGKKKVDEFFGATEVIYKRADIDIPIIAASDAADSYTLAYQYQGCVEDRICYPPVTKYLAIDKVAGLIKISHEKPAFITNSDPAETVAIETVSEQGQFTRLLEDESLLLIIGLFFLAGIGLTFTPCVFPMIPILSSIIAGQGESLTTRNAFTLSLVYVLAMATTYAIVGAVVGFYGAEFNIQIWFQDPIILSVFAAIFVLLALSMFGFYDIQMPSAIQSRLASLSHSQKGGTLIGVGLMGFLSAIIVGPCITAPLVGALIFISQTQNWQLGGLALFALGLGMGVPLLMIGTSAGRFLPRAGLWMDRVKVFFGISLIAVAIYLLERILPVGITMTLVAALLIASAIYLGALDSLDAGSSGWRRFAKAMGILILIYGIAYLVGVAGGSRDLIQPLRGMLGSGGSQGGAHQGVVFRQVKGSSGLQAAIDNAVQQGQGTMLDFYADWCISCKEMEKYTFSDASVQQALAPLALLQADVTANDEEDSQLMSSLGIYGPPAILFFDASGREIAGRRVVGYMSAADFNAHVRASFQ